ncbi:GntR family transcriptional regulator [Piscinibacter koreensis]|uniref:GntR family transcriptional regulator n=1 Tax=Piscinibacter koreensis TaxID=2742824 RepID=A0A7Y6NS80_9BURK|nr:GntR family transcriptional regulator [Schlegelella koreensis]NUZ08370.1 GntR family transcriptional regulator [Schlegelella koreensis]
MNYPERSKSLLVVSGPSNPRLKSAPSALAPSLVDHAYDTIRRRILENVYQPGAQALESDLAAELGISRTPLREALIRLQNEGLIEIIPRHGMRVLPVSATDMKEIYEVITALESCAVELVARRRLTPAELKPLVDATREMTLALKAKDLEAWARADESFHKYLIEAAGNRLLVEALQQYRDRAHRALMFSVRLRPRLETSAKEHLALVEMLRKGDVAGAVEVNRAHRERASQELLDIFERYRLQQL